MLDYWTRIPPAQDTKRGREMSGFGIEYLKTITAPLACCLVGCTYWIVSVIRHEGDKTRAAIIEGATHTGRAIAGSGGKVP